MSAALAQPLVALAGAFLALALAAAALVLDRRSPAHRAFALGMLLLAALQVLSGLPARSSDEMLGWWRWRSVVGALSIAPWLAFSLAFGRASDIPLLRAWKWAILAAIVLPLALTAAFPEAILDGGLAASGELSHVFVRLGWSGIGLHVVTLLGLLLVLVNLEATFRASTGIMRWRIKFFLLTLAGLFAILVYTISQALLFRAVDSRMVELGAWSLLVAEILLVVSAVRLRHAVEVYVSQTALFTSLTVGIAGVYFVVVGILPAFARYLGGPSRLPYASFWVFVALLLLTAFLFSDRLRHQLRVYLNRTLGRPQYDYRNMWTTFTERTSAVVDSRGLCSAVVRIASETLAVPSVTIWLTDESPGNSRLGASTAFSETSAIDLAKDGELGDLMRAMWTVPGVVDFAPAPPRSGKGQPEVSPGLLSRSRMRYCLRLSSGEDVVGVMALGERITGEDLTFEDLSLLKTIGDQAAAKLHGFELADRLLRAKELEAFQTVSAFFVHDLKNLASRLSVTMQNLPNHYQDPDFRRDMLGVITRSVDKINGLCSRLSSLVTTLELSPTATDVNALVQTTLAGLEGSLKATVTMELGTLPQVVVDGEQIQKILLNLILNADAEVGADGVIRVGTEVKDGWVVLSVADNGAGMTPEFINRSLFRAFQTTKSQGLGIGLFHSQKIAEAHGGRIVAESEPGLGSTFRVFLPLNPG